MNSQFWPPAASATISSTSPETAMPPRMSSPVRAWLNDSPVASFIGVLSFSPPSSSAAGTRAGSTTTTGTRPCTASPAAASGQNRRSAGAGGHTRRSVHHAQDLVGRRAPRRRPSSRYPPAVAGEAAPPPRWRSPRRRRRGAAADSPRACGALNVAPQRVEVEDAHHLAAHRRLAQQEAAVAGRHDRPGGTCTTSRAASAARPIISRASAGPTQTTTVTG